MTPGARRPLGVLWRGPLDSCNYACSYCPFAKRRALRRVLDADRAALTRLVAWAERAPFALDLLFTPYGEALIWPWYRDALGTLSHLPQVRRVSIQTNGSAPSDFLDRCNLDRLSLWISWHPTEIGCEDFAARVRALHARGVRLSVGAVAVPAHLEAVEALRALLPAGVPTWINAQKPGVRYDADTMARWTRLDPTFPLDVRPHVSRGRACATGEDVVSVDGDGTVRRCHFVPEILGNLYTDDLGALLGPRPCPRARCDCYIGYAHLRDLGLRDVFGAGLLGRARPIVSTAG
jgi:MoaA/NifB/PqqE/SkfB family radical SAM enzyme